MSQWTQVNGHIRLDIIGLSGSVDSDIEKVREILGPEELWDDINTGNVVPSTLPRGSEGSIEYTFWAGNIMEKTGNVTSIHGNQFSIAIRGSLRDYDENDYQEMKKWFEETLLKLSKVGTIRQAVLQVDVDGIQRYVLTDVKKDFELVGIRETKIPKKDYYTYGK